MKSLVNPTLIVPAFLLLAVSGCDRSGSSPAAGETLPPAAVQVQTLRVSKQPLAEEVVGTVRARLEARLEARVSGRIEALNVVPGQKVEAGQVLASLHAPELRARLEQATARRQQAAQDQQRYTALLERKAVTQAEFDAVQAQARVAEAAVAEAESMLGYAEVTAPFAGVITRKAADVGDLATPGKLLLEMEDPSSLRFEADMAEALLGRVKMGQEMRVRLAQVTGSLAGTISELSPVADPATRTFTVKLDLPAMPGLRSGQFGRVSVPVGEGDALVVPSEAVIRRGQLEYVFIEAGGKAQLRLVKTGRVLNEGVELLAGAMDGERVVVTGAAQLREGQPLNVQP